MIMDEKKLKLRENEFNSDRVKLNQNSFKIENNFPVKSDNININSNKFFTLKSSIINTHEPIIILNPKIKEKIYKYYLTNQNIESYDFSEEDRKKFLYERFGKEQKLECNILIRPDSFYAYSITQHFILSAHKIKKKLRSNYIISSDYENNNNDNIIGQLNSNLFRNEFILYNNGISPKKFNENENNFLRKYLVQIKFKNENNFKIGHIYIPKYGYDKNQFYNKDKDKNDKLSNLDSKDIIVYQNETPELDVFKGYYVNNFSSRVKEKSENNFRIVDKVTNHTILECGKISDNAFSMDFSYPFSPLEAFGICVSFLK